VRPCPTAARTPPALPWRDPRKPRRLRRRRHV
jgi:hypothetical protein